MPERGSRIDRTFDLMRRRILEGEWEDGARLPAHRDLADAFGIAPLTMRAVLARLEDHGLVVRRQGSGTYVRRFGMSAVLIVDDEPDLALLLAEYVRAHGFDTVIASSVDDGVRALEANPLIKLVFSDVRVPTADDGIAFIQTVRRRWPRLALAAVTAFPLDLTPLRATSDWPVLVIPKPFHAEQIEHVLRLILPASSPTAGA